jgi:hypothetical protein
MATSVSRTGRRANGKSAIKKSERNNPVRRSIRIRKAAAAPQE